MFVLASFFVFFFVSGASVILFFVFGCQLQCNRLSRKTRPRSDVTQDVSSAWDV